MESAAVVRARTTPRPARRLRRLAARQPRRAERRHPLLPLGASAPDALLPAGRVHVLGTRAKHRRNRPSGHPGRSGAFPGATRAVAGRPVLDVRRPRARVPADAGRTRDRDLARSRARLPPVPPPRARLAILARSRSSGARLAESDPRVAGRRRSDRIPARARRGVCGGGGARLPLSPRSARRRRPRGAGHASPVCSTSCSSPC